MKSEASNLRAGLLLAAIAFGVVSRLDGVTTTPFFGDEYHTLKSALSGSIFHFDNLGSHVLTPLLLNVFRGWFGPEVSILRLVALVPGIAALVLCYPIGRALVGETAAAVATFWLAVNPMHVYYSGFARPYALVLLLGMILVHGVVQLIDEERPLARWRIGVCACAILLLHAHLSSAGLVGSVAITYVVVAWRSRRSVRALGLALAPFALAGVVALLLYLPVLEQVQAFMNKEHPRDVRGPMSWFELPLLLAGGVAAGWVMTIGVPAGLVTLARERPRRAALMAAAVLGPLIALYATRPYGMGYAYSRYLLSGLPFMLMGVSWLMVKLFRNAERSALVAGFLLAGAAHLSGPLAPWHDDEITFPKSYLAMRRLPAFDSGWHDASPIYSELAEDDSVTRIIEAPLLRSRTALLYRQHQKIHGKEVLMGVGQQGLGPELAGPYDALDDPKSLKRSGAEVLIYHRAPGNELLRYWSFVFDEAWPEVEGRAIDKGLMERHGSIFYNNVETTAPPTELLGEPHYSDKDVLVWRLRRGRL